MIIVAGGKGERAGEAVPKQLQTLGDKRVYEWSVAIAQQHPGIDEVVLVVPRGDEPAYRLANFSNLLIAPGGETRSESVLNGLQALSLSDRDAVLIHDAARPGLTSDIVSALLTCIENADAGAPALPVMDALKRRDGQTLESIDRQQLFRVQTPQVFRYRQILDALSGTGMDYVDDLAAIEATGGKVDLIDGSERLAKITLPGDHERLSQLLLPKSTPVRIGSGFDVHAFGPGDHVTLCGVSIPHSQALAGHSDADVAWHALTDAILGAAALGDIGDHFPPSDPQWANADSSLFLRHAVKLATEAGYALVNCDITIICETPKVKPHRLGMRERTAEVTGLALDAISVKATTTEGLGFTGRGEGIAAMATATVRLPV